MIRNAVRRIARRMNERRRTDARGFACFHARYPCFHLDEIANLCVNEMERQGSGSSDVFSTRWTYVLVGHVSQERFGLFGLLQTACVASRDGKNE